MPHTLHTAHCHGGDPRSLTATVPSRRDNLRGFFEQVFPTLLRRLFGYDGSSWLTAVAKVQASFWAACLCPPLSAGPERNVYELVLDAPRHCCAIRLKPRFCCLSKPCMQGGKEADARALLKLLSPTGVLFSACYAADADGLIRFVFPTERLPTHTQVQLDSRIALCLTWKCCQQQCWFPNETTPTLISI